MLKYLEVLHPLCQKTEHAVRAIESIARKIPQVVNDKEVLHVQMNGKSTNQNTSLRVDTGRLDQKNQSAQYSMLPKFVKTCLAYGNANVERSLSENIRAVIESDCMYIPLRWVHQWAENHQRCYQCYWSRTSSQNACYTCFAEGSKIF